MSVICAHTVSEAVLNINIRLVTRALGELRSLKEDLICLKESVVSLNDSVRSLREQLTEHKQQTATTDTITQQMNTKLNTLISDLSQHQQQTVAESAQFQTSFTQLHQNLTNNITHQLETIHSSVEQLPVYTCGGTGGWRRVVYLDMTDPSTSCPSGWQLTGYSKRTCGRASGGGTICDSVTFTVSGGQYSRVCGRIKAYQRGATLAFYFHNPITSIDGAYITGFSLTHGYPREHIWTFAAGISEQQYSTGVSNCPCGTNRFSYWNSRIPSFIGNEYFWESGLNGVWIVGSQGYHIFPDDPLWDGENCPTGTCCSFSNPPFFSKTLDSSTSDDLELRLCNYHPSTYSDVPVELIELYVK